MRGLFAAVWVWVPGWAAAAECPPSATLSGDPALLATVREALSERGVAVPAKEGCVGVQVRLSAVEQGIALAMLDGEGRSADRIAEDLDASAVLIESWTRPDLVDPLLLSRSRPQRTGLGSPELPAPRPPGPRSTPDAVALERRYDASASLEAALSGDGALWAGMRGQGCARVGASCLGALVRYAYDLRERGDSLALDTARTALDLMLTAERPIQWGSLELVPGLGLGQTSVRSVRRTPGVEDDEHTQELLLRVHLGVRRALSRTLSLRLDLSASGAPFASTRLGGEEEDGVQEPPLAGPPRLFTALGLGVAVGGP